MNNIRQIKIKEYISDKQYVSLDEVRGLCPDVTLMTLHRDLDALAREGLVYKLRGGARVVGQSGDPSFKSRETFNVGAKGIIAAKAVELIAEGGAIFIDAGTTTLAVIRALQDINLTVITNGANFANELQRFANVTTYMCCGALNRSNMALSGQSTLDFLGGINIDLGLLGVTGYSDGSGFTCGKESEMHVKKLIIQKARKSVVLMDASKLTRIMPYTFADLEDIDYVIGDGALPGDFIRRAEAAGVIIM
jgi:DeoR/GlpR family transcriptional regulator of sugar metabolism